MVPTPAELKSSWNLLETYMLGSLSRPTGLENTVGRAQQMCLKHVFLGVVIHDQENPSQGPVVICIQSARKECVLGEAFADEET